MVCQAVQNLKEVENESRVRLVEWLGLWWEWRRAKKVASYFRQRDQHSQRHRSVKSELCERRPAVVWRGWKRDESGRVKWGKVHLRPVEFLSGFLSTIWLVQYSEVQYSHSDSSNPNIFPCHSDGFTTLILILRQIGHMAELPSYRNSLSHLPWVMFIFSSWASDFSSMWLLIGLIFWATVSVRKIWLGNKYLRDSWFKMKALF